MSSETCRARSGRAVSHAEASVLPAGGPVVGFSRSRTPLISAPKIAQASVGYGEASVDTGIQLGGGGSGGWAVWLPGDRWWAWDWFSSLSATPLARDPGTALFPAVPAGASPTLLKTLAVESLGWECCTLRDWSGALGHGPGERRESRAGVQAQVPEQVESSR